MILFLKSATIAIIIIIICVSKRGVSKEDKGKKKKTHTHTHTSYTWNALSYKLAGLQIINTSIYKLVQLQR